MSAIAIDTETTGFADEDRIIELAIVDFDTREIVLNTRLCPDGRRIHPKAMETHGISDDMVRNAPRFMQIADAVKIIIENAESVIGHNPYFDRRFLDLEFARCEIAAVNWPLLVDTKRIWDVYEPPQSRDLQSAYQRFVSSEGYTGRHGALADTQACAEVMKAQIDHFGLHDKPWTELDPERKTWWGPTRHIVIVHDELIMNFGKHKESAVWEVDLGFWSWVINKDFPVHVQLLGMKMQEFNDHRKAVPDEDWPGFLRNLVNHWGLEYRSKL